MIAYIILITFVGSVFMSYKLGEISGFRKGFNECDKMFEKSLRSYSSILEECKEKNEIYEGKQNEK